MIPLATRRAAMLDPTRHQFVRGLGHIPHGAEPDLPPGYPPGSANCLPPAGAADGSVHIMNPSHGAPPMRMRWLAAHQAWAPLSPEKGNRMAWTADYLSRAGWEYAGPEAAPKRGKR